MKTKTHLTTTPAAISLKKALEEVQGLITVAEAFDSKLAEAEISDLPGENAGPDEIVNHVEATAKSEAIRSQLGPRRRAAWDRAHAKALEIYEADIPALVDLLMPEMPEMHADRMRLMANFIELTKEHLPPEIARRVFIDKSLCARELDQIQRLLTAFGGSITQGIECVVNKARRALRIATHIDQTGSAIGFLKKEAGK